MPTLSAGYTVWGGLSTGYRIRGSRVEFFGQVQRDVAADDSKPMLVLPPEIYPAQLFSGYGPAFAVALESNFQIVTPYFWADPADPTNANGANGLWFQLLGGATPLSTTDGVVLDGIGWELDTAP